MSADVELSLPQLQKLDIFAVHHASITLICPQLKTLHVDTGIPLETFDGIPPGIQELSFFCSVDGSLSLFNMLWGKRLDQLERLRILMPQHSYDSHVASEVIKQVLRESKLTWLVMGCPVEQLSPLTGPGGALPASLQHLTLDLPLDRGIPVDLEQLTNLESLTLRNTKQGPMHLSRSLDPFLDMKNLVSLGFMGKPTYTKAALQTRYEWTPGALEFLLLARIRLQKEAETQGSRRSRMLWC